MTFVNIFFSPFHFVHDIRPRNCIEFGYYIADTRKNKEKSFEMKEKWHDDDWKLNCCCCYSIDTHFVLIASIQLFFSYNFPVHFFLCLKVKSNPANICNDRNFASAIIHDDCIAYIYQFRYAGWWHYDGNNGGSTTQIR